MARLILGMAALALAGCATTVTTGSANRGVLAAQGCYEAANGRVAARQWTAVAS
jgi:hypothetical protein